MKAKLRELAERRAILVERAAAQRTELSQQLAPWQGALTVVDQGVAAVRYVRNHPELLAAMVAFAVMIRPRRVVSLLRRGWALWGMLRVVGRRLTEP